MSDKLNYKCLVVGCGHVVRTIQGVTTHIKKKHPKRKVTRGITFSPTVDSVTNPKRNGPHKAKKQKPAAPVPVITPKTRQIDVPCILRIGIEDFKIHLQGVFATS